SLCVSFHFVVFFGKMPCSFSSIRTIIKVQGAGVGLLGALSFTRSLLAGRSESGSHFPDYTICACWMHWLKKGILEVQRCGWCQEECALVVVVVNRNSAIPVEHEFLCSACAEV